VIIAQVETENDKREPPDARGHKGLKVGELYDSQQISDVVVWGAPGVRNDIDALRQMYIGNPTGGEALFSDLADVQIVPMPNVVQR
jgi:Cu/Ag efflux pump CusA